MLVGALIGSIFMPQTGSFPDKTTGQLFLDPLIGAILGGVAWSVFAYTVFLSPKR